MKLWNFCSLKAPQEHYESLSKAALTSRRLFTKVRLSVIACVSWDVVRLFFCCIFWSRSWFRTSLKDIFIGVLLIMET